MKRKACILVVLLQLLNNASSQTIFKFIDASSHQPIPFFWLSVFKDDHTFQGQVRSDSTGLGVLLIRAIDSTSKYELISDRQEFLPIRQRFEPLSKDTVIVKVKSLEYYVPKSDSLYANWCGGIGFGRYQPEQFKSLSEFPDSIETLVVSYLRRKAGPNYEDLTLAGSYILDLKELKKIYPRINFESAYYLCFSYRNIPAGIAAYTSWLKLDEHGAITGDLLFPSTKEKLKIISYNKIQNIAKSEGLSKYYSTPPDPGTRKKIEFKYIEKENLLCWVFTNEVFLSNGQIETEKVFYNASTGQFLRKDNLSGLWTQ